jgi:hypothetical protein
MKPEKAKDERHAKPKECPNPITEETKKAFDKR